jgi:hypothetical protein
MKITISTTLAQVLLITPLMPMIKIMSSLAPRKRTNPIDFSLALSFLLEVEEKVLLKGPLFYNKLLLLLLL